MIGPADDDDVDVSPLAVALCKLIAANVYWIGWHILNGR